MRSSSEPATVTRLLFAFALAACLLIAAADAMAQFGGGGMGGGGMGGGRSRGGGGSRDQQQQQKQQQERPPQEIGANMLEQTIEELRVDLKLQPTQLPAWEAYVTRARLLASDIARERMQTVPVTQNSALKRIDRSVDAARNRLAALEELSDSARAFYALLTPDQQSVADPRLAALVPGPGSALLAQVPPKSVVLRPGVSGAAP